jgi:hypothetical protein
MRRQILNDTLSLSAALSVLVVVAPPVPDVELRRSAASAAGIRLTVSGSGGITTNTIYWDVSFVLGRNEIASIKIMQVKA